MSQVHCRDTLCFSPLILHKTVWIYFFDMRNYFKSNPNVRESGGNKDKGEGEKKRGEEL